jgi:hypothetical protein
METTIRKNESFSVLATATGKNHQELENAIVETLVENQLILESYEDYGKTIQEIMDENQEEIDDFIKFAFPEKEVNSEIAELLKGIYIWGNGSENPCPECGCEMEVENDGIGTVQWVDFKCENPNCNYAESGEPDWDTMPGGIDYDNQ